MRLFLLLLLLSWLAGIAAGQWQVRLLVITLVLLIAFPLTYFRTRSPALLVAISALAGLGYLYGASPVPSMSSECAVPETVQGTIVAVPRHGLSSSRYEVQVTTGCTVLVTTSRFPEYGLGDVLEINGSSPQAVSELAQENPGYAGYLQRHGIHATWLFPTVQRLKAGERRAILYGALDRRIVQLFREPDTSVVRALILADDSGLPEKLKDNFRATGLTHLLAISGMNISLWAAMLILLLQPLPLSPLSRTLVISGLLWIYMALIHWPISAVRATFFWTIALLALRLQALVSLPTIVLLTLAGMLSFQPLLVQDVGFQLSVSAVVGIFLMLFVTKKVFVKSASWLKIVYGLLAVTLGATLTTWPIIAFHFGTLSFTSLLANMLVAPVVELQMAAVVFTLLTGSISHSLALLPSFVTHLTVQWMDLISTALASLPHLYWQEISLSVGAVTIYYSGLLAVSHLLLRWQRRSWREVWE